VQIKSKVEGELSQLIDTDLYKQYYVDVAVLSIMAVNCRTDGTELEVKIYSATSLEDLGKKMTKIRNCFKEKRGFCDLNGES
jgi:hypothetical protein